MKRVLQRWLAQYFSTEEAVLLSIFLVVSVVVVATLGDVLGPVIAAMIFTFLLQGVVNSLQKYGLAKIPSVLTTYLLFFSGFYLCVNCTCTHRRKTDNAAVKRTSQYGLPVKRIV
jgi:putative permease